MVMTRDEIMALENRELDAQVAEQIMGWVWTAFKEAHKKNAAMIRKPYPPNSWEAGRKDNRATGDEPLAHLWDSDLPHYSTDVDDAHKMEATIETRGLVERYVLALIDVLGLDMQPFNSAIELGWWSAPTVRHNTFKADGCAYLWLLLRATPKERCQAALMTVMQ